MRRGAPLMRIMVINKRRRSVIIRYFREEPRIFQCPLYLGISRRMRKKKCHTMEKTKTTNKASISNKEAKSTTIGLKETEINKALPAVGSSIDYSIVIL